MNNDAVVKGVNENNGPPEITAKLKEENHGWQKMSSGTASNHSE